MAQVANVDQMLSDHRQAVALMEEMGIRLGVPKDYLVELAERVTGRPWDELDTAGAEAIADLLAEALHRTVSVTT